MQFSFILWSGRISEVQERMGVRERRQSMNESVQPETSSYSSQTSLSPSNPKLSLLIPALPLLPLSSILTVSPSSGRPPPQSRPEWSMKATVLGLRQRLEDKGDGGRGAQEPEEKSIFCLCRIQMIEPTQSRFSKSSWV